MTINTTGLTNITSLQGIAAYTNDATSGILFTGAIIVFFFIITLILAEKNPIEHALAVSSWSMFIISLFFWLAHLIPVIVVLPFLFIAGFTTLYLYATRR